MIRHDRASGELDWDAFLDLASRAGALGHAFPAFALCEKLAPGTVSPRVLEACRAEAPPSVRRVVARLSPAEAQRVVRCSLEERFMWTPSLMGKMRQVARELAPSNATLAELAAIYRMRAWRLARGTLTR